MLERVRSERNPVSLNLGVGKARSAKADCPLELAQSAGEANRGRGEGGAEEAALHASLAASDRGSKNWAAHEIRPRSRCQRSHPPSQGTITFTEREIAAISQYSKGRTGSARIIASSTRPHTKEFCPNRDHTQRQRQCLACARFAKRARTVDLWVDTTVVPVVGKDGKPRSTRQRADITERKSSREA